MTTTVRAAALTAAALLAARPRPRTGRPGPSRSRPRPWSRSARPTGTRPRAKYKGKRLRVTGKVHSVYDEVLYLAGGGDDQVVIRFGKGAKPAVKPGEAAAFDGTFDLVAVLGPA